MKTKYSLLLLLFFCSISSASASTYTDKNKALVSFDVSMPIDATGYLLHGHNLTGGETQFSDNGAMTSPLLAEESGSFNTPTATDKNNEPLIKTHIQYKAIKFINPNGIDNFFIKIGAATRTQTVKGLDPKVLKDGTYTWQVPIFAVGNESDTVTKNHRNIQFIEVGSYGGPAGNNAMYTQNFYLYAHGAGKNAISAHPIKTDRSDETFSKPQTAHFNCKATGLWGAGGADPYRTVTGHCKGIATTFPAGPNLDNEVGSITLPSVHTPWTATKQDHCMMGGKKHAGCTNATINLSINYTAQKIRVPINKNISIFAEYGTAYRRITPVNLRYICSSNVYLKNILPKADCKQKSFLPGGASYPLFSVGFQYKASNGVTYSARYINIRGQENGNRLAWLDASDTQIYAVSASKKVSVKTIRKNLQHALDVTQHNRAIYNVLGTRFFQAILNNKML